jgi:hypothetical protein
MLRETKEQSLGKNLAVSFANKIEYVVWMKMDLIMNASN